MSMEFALSSDDTLSSALPKLLVVDDNSLTLSTIHTLFRDYYRVTQAESGLHSLELLAEAPFDVVLLSLELADLTALEVLDTIRIQPHTANLPVILLADPADRSALSRALQLGASDYVFQPVDPQAIWARVGTQVALKQVLEDREHALRRLEQSGEIYRLVRMTTHDLKAPLANIRIAEEILRRIIDDDPDGQQIMDSMTFALDSMQEVIEDFLHACTVQHEMALDLTPVPVETALYETMLQFNPAAQRKAITLTVDSSPGYVLADPMRLGQILSNLVSNAIKYSPPNTTVQLWSQAAGDRVRVHIADQGPGIPAHERHLLFTEFGKLSTRPTGQENRTGLGLWIVKHLVEAMRGTVDVDCPPDGGSIFWFELPSC
jgi:two-component system, sensor histidine kinase and response regulator